jgi:type 1 glutamine amidotransferase
MPKALMVYGGWDGHEPEATTRIFEQVLKDEGFEVRVEPDMDVYTDADYMRSIDLVVPTWTMGQISKEQSEGLCQAVFAGTNLGGWHGGMCGAFRGKIEYQLMAGRQFLNHPGGIIDYEVNIRDSQDPITRGLSDFAMHSEQYNMLTYPANEVLATTTLSGQHGNSEYLAGVIMPVVWKKMYGKGRVFYSALGHVATDFDVPECKEIQRRGLLWAAGCLDGAAV